ncbi:MAG: hypothetical protein D3X82_02895 [Candidatus Leucobacter sulfamidivorax]|jgi:hypothetical protein|nr:hypothetical protein [Candidatus Leucobacter sulfamidivorax]
MSSSAATESVSESPRAAADSVFAPSTQPSAGVGSVLLVILTAVLVFGGFYVMSIAFSFEPAIAAWVFCAGLALDVIGFWLSFGLISALGRR